MVNAAYSMKNNRESCFPVDKTLLRSVIATFTRKLVKGGHHGGVAPDCYRNERL
jgi:hypothetical protein